MKTFTSMAVVLACLIFSHSSLSIAQQGEPALTNTEIIKLSKTGIGDEVIIAKINQAKEVKFNLDTDSLIKLKEEGVNQKIIAAMLHRGKQPDGQMALPPSMIPQVPGIPAAGMRGGIKLSTKDGDYDLIPVQGRMTRAGFAIVHITLMHYPGLNAKIRTRDQRPSIKIFSESNPSANLYVVKLSQDAKDLDRELKFGENVLFKRSLGLTPDSDWTIQYQCAEISPGIWEIKILSDLKPGEYGLLQSLGLYDFGVD